EGEGTGRLEAGGDGLDPLRATVGHRLVDGQRGPSTGQGHGQLDLGDDGPTAPVRGREGVEVGAEGEFVARQDAQRGAALDLVRVDRGTGRDRLAHRRRVELLRGPVGT